MQEQRIVVGYKGFVGRAIYELFDCHVGIDVDGEHGMPIDGEAFRILHVCIPGGIHDFVDVVSAYIQDIKPCLCIVHSTVKPGTTRALSKASGYPVVHVPFHGKHTESDYAPVGMTKDPYRYIMSVGYADIQSGVDACHYVMRYGFKPELYTAETTELAKIMSTCLQGVVIESWNDFYDRSKDVGASWDGVCRIISDIAEHEPYGYLNRVFQIPGQVDHPLSKKHCVSSNKELLDDGE